MKRTKIIDVHYITMLQDSEEEKPWEGKKPEQILKKSDFPDTVKIVRANMLYIEKSGLSNPALKKCGYCRGIIKEYIR